MIYAGGTDRNPGHLRDGSFFRTERRYNDSGICYCARTLPCAPISRHPKLPEPIRFPGLYPQESMRLRYARISDQSDRTSVRNPAIWPNCVTGQLLSKFRNGDEHGGSAVMVGPRQVLTCAHNVLEEKGFVKSAVFYPALDGTVAPFGAAKVTHVIPHPDWSNNSFSNPSFDMALLILDRDMGIYTGYAGLTYYDDQLLTRNMRAVEQTVQITGYPDGRECVMRTSNVIMTDFTPESFSYTGGAGKGQSGSGIGLIEGDSLNIFGIHTNSDEINGSGVRFSLEKFNWIVYTMYNTRDDDSIQRLQRTPRNDPGLPKDIVFLDVPMHVTIDQSAEATGLTREQIQSLRE